MTRRRQPGRHLLTSHNVHLRRRYGSRCSRRIREDSDAHTAAVWACLGGRAQAEGIPPWILKQRAGCRMAARTLAKSEDFSIFAHSTTSANALFGISHRRRCRVREKRWKKRAKQAASICLLTTSWAVSHNKRAETQHRDRRLEPARKATHHSK